MSESLIIAPGYPHVLLGHIRRLIRDNDMSFLVDNTAMMSEYRREYPEDTNGIYELEAAYRLGLISEMASILNEPAWRKRSFINKYAMLLMREPGFRECQMAELIETFMQIFDWDIELEVNRRWSTTEEDSARFHETVAVDTDVILPNGARQDGRNDGRHDGSSDDGRGTAMVAVRDVSQPQSEQGNAIQDFDGKQSVVKSFRSVPHQQQVKGEEMFARAVSDSFLTQGGYAELGRNEKHLPNDVKYVNKLNYNVNEVYSSMSQKEFIQNEILKNGIKFERMMSRSERNDVKSAIKGNSDAQYRIAEFYAIPGSPHTDYICAARWYKLSASQGNRKAQFALGMLYDSGRIKCTDYKKMALECYMALAESGFPTAQCTIGLKYRFGDGVGENQEEAARWLKKAAAQGHVDAQRNLGDMYLGTGNEEEALRWFQRAAAMGDVYSKKQVERFR